MPMPIVDTSTIEAVTKLSKNVHDRPNRRGYSVGKQAEYL